MVGMRLLCVHKIKHYAMWELLKITYNTLNNAHYFAKYGQ